MMETLTWSIKIYLFFRSPGAIEKPAISPFLAPFGGGGIRRGRLAKQSKFVP